MRTLKVIFCLIILSNLINATSLNNENVTNEKKHQLKLRSGSFVPEKLEAVEQKRAIDYDQFCYDGYYYTILQFNEIPNTETVEKLKLADVHLGNYLPEYAYRAKISTGISQEHLTKYNVRAIHFIKPKNKISKKLSNKFKLNNYVTEAFKTGVAVNYDLSLSKENIENELGNIINNQLIELKGKHIVFECTEKQVQQIAQLPFVYSISTHSNELIQLASSATVQTRGKYFHNPSNDISPKLTGAGIKVGVIDKLTNHPDMKKRIVRKNRCLTVEKDDGHGSLTKGLVAGNGNLNPDLMGMAPESIILDGTTEDINNSLDFFTENNAVASIHPYGNMQCPKDNQTQDFEECPMGIYDEVSEALDRFFKSNPYQLGVYAAGNSRNTYTNTCSNQDYPKVVHDYPLHFNTIVHAGQTAKNTLTVGGISNLDRSSSLSSRGPARDGRLKPELVAEACVKGPVNDNEYGTICGTSFSAPIVGGGVALLGEAYEELAIDNNNDMIPDLPKAGLIKAILCNTADDLGNPGPDFTFGFGRPNFKRAYENLVVGNYEEKTISSSDLNGNQFTDQINLTIPSTVYEVNVTLYWPDAAGDAGSGNDVYKLVNDLDLSMYQVSQSNLVYKPYVLDSGGVDEDSGETETCGGGTTNEKYINVLNNAIIATCENNTCKDQNGNEITNQTSDHLNNIEKITIENPTAGDWMINVDGLIRESNFEELDFFVSYEFKYAGLEMSYPRGGESFEPGQSFYITWETTGEYTGFEVHYKDVLNPAPNNPWIPIATTFNSIDESYDGTDLPPSQLFYKWNIPEDFQHTRVSICITGNKMNGQSERVCTSESVNIMSTPEINKTVNYQTQTVTLQWPSVTGADKYEVYKLGDETMELKETVVESANNVFTDQISRQGYSAWYSIKAIDDEVNGVPRDSSIISKRANAVEVVKEFPNDFYVKVFLEGAMKGDYSGMRTDLYDLELLWGMEHNPCEVIPLGYKPPYGIFPWNYKGFEGYDLCTKYGQWGVAYEPTDVDWVLVSLRSKIEKDAEVFAFAGILTSDGIIRLDDPKTQICDIGDGPFYVLVEHQNHLPVMSPEPVKIVDGALFYDFTLQNSWSVANSGQKQLPNGKWAAFAGNCTQQSIEVNPQYDRNDIFGEDKILWQSSAGKFRLFHPADMNLDGDINGEDKALWFNNFGAPRFSFQYGRLKHPTPLRSGRISTAIGASLQTSSVLKSILNVKSQG